MSTRLRWNGSQDAYEEHLRALRSSKKAKPRSKRRPKPKKALQGPSERLDREARRDLGKVASKPRRSLEAASEPLRGYSDLDDEFQRLVKSF